MKTVLLASAATAALCLLAFTHQPWSDAPISTADPVDAVIGAGGFNLVYPVVPGNGLTHDTQMTRRLTVIEMLLRQRDVSAWPAELRAERERNLDRLHAYHIRAESPRNYDHPDQLLPCFIDRDGRICAVGYLVEQSVGRAVSEKINASHQYQTIAQIHEPVLDRWIAASGLTRTEVETIQGPEPWESRNRRAVLAKQITIADTIVQQRPSGMKPSNSAIAQPSQTSVATPTARPAIARPQPLTKPTQPGATIE